MIKQRKLYRKREYNSDVSVYLFHSTSPSWWRSLCCLGAVDPDGVRRNRPRDADHEKARCGHGRGKGRLGHGRGKGVKGAGHWHKPHPRNGELSNTVDEDRRAAEDGGEARGIKLHRSKEV